jgi:hypothetical protein
MVSTEVADYPEASSIRFIIAVPGDLKQITINIIHHKGRPSLHSTRILPIYKQNKNKQTNSMV